MYRTLMAGLLSATTLDEAHALVDQAQANLARHADDDLGDEDDDDM